MTRGLKHSIDVFRSGEKRIKLITGRVTAPTTVISFVLLMAIALFLTREIRRVA